MASTGPMTSPQQQQPQQWYPGTTTMTHQELEGALLRPTGLVGFLDQHPHFMSFAASKFEEIGLGVHEEKEGYLRAVMDVLLTFIQKQDATLKNSVTAARAEMAKAVAPVPQVVSGMDLGSDHFISQLTDTEITVIQNLHTANHNISTAAGYAEYNHADPAQATAVVTPWGQTSRGDDGQWNMAYHTNDIYGTPNNGYSSAPPNGMPNPWQPQPQGQPSLQGTLLTGALSFFGGGQQQQYAPPPPQQQQYWHSY